jgi:hypothetical protein
MPSVLVYIELYDIAIEEIDENGGKEEKNG